jgi:hypothetical protein
MQSAIEKGKQEKLRFKEAQREREKGKLHNS